MRRLGLLTVVLVGCTRTEYREWADRDTYPVVSERVVVPAFDVGRTRVEPPPGSRLADPFNPDRPPKPPDDPAAALFMEHPYKLRGSNKWGQDGYTDQIEGPGWAECLGVDPGGTLKLTQNRAVEVALLNSREYQTALEDVYLSALSLTLNRFEFDVHWFGRNSTTYTHFGSGGFPTETNTLSSNSDLGFSQNFAAGGQLVADFANAFVYEYTGHTGSFGSNLAFTLTQPLLRNAGRQVRLEALTQAERDVLYAVRSFARFRKQFWAQTAVQSGGYLDLLLSLQTVRNSRENLRLQEESYRLTSELFRGGRASAVEYDQAYRGVLAARQSIIDSEASLQTSLDAFKLRLGLPPRLPVELDDALLGQFVLTDPSAETLRDDIEAFQRARLRELDDVPAAPALAASFDALARLAGRGPAVVQQATGELARLKALLGRPERPGEDRELRDRMKTAYDDLATGLPEVAADLKKVANAIGRHRGLVATDRKAAWETMTVDMKTLLAVVDAAIAAQTQARIYLIELPEVAVTEPDALMAAKANRLDLMNDLGGVTDAWRKVTVAANALKTDLNLVATANLGTDRDHKNPFNYAAQASTYTVGVQVDTPLNRRAERNAYRASLITYQRAKRTYVALSDQIEQQVRFDLRQLNRLRVSFEIARQSLLSSARQYENARLTLLGPRDRRSADSTTINLQQGLTALLAARNSLAATYINYEQQRVQLLLDLEALQLDPRGFPTHVGRPDPGAGPERPTGPAEPPAPDAGDPLFRPREFPPVDGPGRPAGS